MFYLTEKKHYIIVIPDLGGFNLVSINKTEKIIANFL